MTTQLIESGKVRPREEARSGEEEHRSQERPSQERHSADTEGGAMSGAVLDIGGDIGALVIYADDHLVGSEIEICPSGRVQEREHNVVRARRTPSGSVYAAVFPALLEGDYTVLTEDLESSHEVTVVGGMVTEIDCCTGGGA